MVNLEELKQFVAFAELGTLAKVAEAFLISAPSLSRNMQHVEESFGVPLFTRSVNKIALNETGKKAVRAAQIILRTAETAIQDVQRFDQAQKTIYISACAPMPLWNILPRLSAIYPQKIISHQISQVEDILSEIKNGQINLAILPFPLENGNYKIEPLLTEKLFISVRPDHELANRSEVFFEEINGYNFLLRSEIGFWDSLCREYMPSSKFLVQNNQFEFDELVRTSSLPRVITNCSADFRSIKKDRIAIPISNPEATVTFYLHHVDRETALEKNHG